MLDASGRHVWASLEEQEEQIEEIMSTEAMQLDAREVRAMGHLTLMPWWSRKVNLRAL